MTEYLTDKEIMQVLRCSRSHLWRLRLDADEGFPPAVKLLGERGLNLTRADAFREYLTRKEASAEARQARRREARAAREAAR